VMDPNPRRGLALIAVVLIPHVLLGFYAVGDGGHFTFGFTAPERFLIHSLSGSEARISVSGAMKHVFADLCLQSSSDSTLDCYDPHILRLECGSGCALVTGKGVVVAREEQTFHAVLKKGILLEDATFRCYGGDCGFDVKLEDGGIYSSTLPEEITH
jgi:hypothetical protein